MIEVAPQDSPRLAWFKKHNVKTWKTEFLKDDPQGMKPWSAWAQKADEDGCPHDGNACVGATEDDAITALVIKFGWKLWNEE